MKVVERFKVYLDIWKILRKQLILNFSQLLYENSKTAFYNLLEVGP